MPVALVEAGAQVTDLGVPDVIGVEVARARAHDRLRRKHGVRLDTPMDLALHGSKRCDAVGVTGLGVKLVAALDRHREVRDVVPDPVQALLQRRGRQRLLVSDEQVSLDPLRSQLVVASSDRGYDRLRVADRERPVADV